MHTQQETTFDFTITGESLSCLLWIQNYMIHKVSSFKVKGRGCCTYPFKNIIRVEGMTAPLTEAPTGPFRRPETSKFYLRDSLAWWTPQVGLGSEGCMDAPQGMHLPVHESRLPLKNIGAYSVNLPLHKGNSTRVPSQLFKNNQQVPCLVQPRARNMVPESL